MCIKIPATDHSPLMRSDDFVMAYGGLESALLMVYELLARWPSQLRVLLCQIVSYLRIKRKSFAPIIKHILHMPKIYNKMPEFELGLLRYHEVKELSTYLEVN